MSLDTRSDGATLLLEVSHERTLVARLAVLLNAHDVTAFTYRADVPRDSPGCVPGGGAVGQTARVEVEVRGGEQQVARAAHRLRRVIGVRSVEVVPSAHGSTCP